ncbi:MAG TPA: hypothetical protein VEA99_14145 [Gemmatimonadaceae bacterium]|nr:hypothetical protein [Gemmatimonadaceae bacterium]
MRTNETEWRSNEGAPPGRRRLLAALATGVAATAASALVPALLISLQAFVTRDADLITRFATAAAEPVALVGASTVVWLASRRAGRHDGLVRGVASTLAMLGAALWVGDVDRWTAIAGVALPTLGLLAGRRGPAIVPPAEPEALPLPMATLEVAAREVQRDPR